VGRRLVVLNRVLRNVLVLTIEDVSILGITRCEVCKSNPGVSECQIPERMIDEVYNPGRLWYARIRKWYSCSCMSGGLYSFDTPSVDS
jgi:hypothetical protein